MSLALSVQIIRVLRQTTNGQTDRHYSINIYKIIIIIIIMIIMIIII